MLRDAWLSTPTSILQSLLRTSQGHGYLAQGFQWHTAIPVLEQPRVFFCSTAWHPPPPRDQAHRLICLCWWILGQRNGAAAAASPLQPTQETIPDSPLACPSADRPHVLPPAPKLSISMKALSCIRFLRQFSLSSYGVQRETVTQAQLAAPHPRLCQTSPQHVLAPQASPRQGSLDVREEMMLFFRPSSRGSSNPSDLTEQQPA